MSVASNLSLALPRPTLSLAWPLRDRRVLLAVAAMWVFNFFDLNFTMIEAQRYDFVELNPVAKRVMRSPQALAAYKLGLVAFGSTILLALRRERLAEFSAWLLAGVYGWVLIRWNLYYAIMVDCANDPARNIDPLLGYIP